MEKLDEQIENADGNLKLILSEFKNLRGQFVITDTWDVERFVAIAEDEWDYYYVTFNGRDLNWHSCVGKLIPLKGYIQDKDYKTFIRIAELNHYDQLDLKSNGNKDAFLKGIESYIEEKYTKKDKFITDFCWDLL